MTTVKIPDSFEYQTYKAAILYSRILVLKCQILWLSLVLSLAINNCAANIIWVNDLRLSSFSATLTAVPIYLQQYKDFSSNVSLACNKRDNKDQLSRGKDWPIAALKDTKCAFHLSYLLNKISQEDKHGTPLQLYQPCSNTEMHEHFKTSTVQQIYKNKS